MLVTRDIGDANAIEIIDGRAQANGIGNVAGACFKALRRRLVEGLLEGDILNHVAAALPGRHRVQDLGLSINNANSCRREDLVAGKNVEVAIDGLHIDAHVRDRLCAIDKYACAVTMRGLDHLLNGHDGAECIGNMREWRRVAFWARAVSRIRRAGPA